MVAPVKTRRVGIRDVAARAGVSLGSASRVINGAPDVAPELRERVQAAIAALGWQPNHAARSLRLRATRTIGCMLTDVTNPLYGQLFHALEERLRAAGYVVLLANSLNQPEREVDILATFAARGMDGVVAAPGNERHPAVQRALRALPMPVVVLDRDIGAGRDRVLFDHAAGMQAVVGHLAGLGHRRIALVLSQALGRPMRRRIEGFRAAVAAHGLDGDESLIVQLPTAMSSSFGAVSLLLARRARPTAMVVLGTHILLEALNAVATQRLAIPHDLSLVSLGDPDFARSYTPPISALRIDTRQAAEQAVALLLDRIRAGGAAGAGHDVQLVPDFVVRQSCAPPAAVRAS